MESIRGHAFARRLAAGAFACAVAGGETLLVAMEAHAQDYPARTVTIISPFPAGGTIDGIARMLGQRLGDRLGKPFVVENRPGAGSVTGATAVAKAAPDGYTLLVAGSSPLAINPALRKELPYDPAKDFVPLALIAHTAFVLVVNPTLDVRSVPDLIGLAKAKPGSLSYASAGPGSPQHICMEMFKRMVGLDMVHVPYKGGALALSDVVAGHVPLMFADLLPSLQLIAEGKVRALAVSSTTRVPSLPELPPLAEAGVPGFDAVAWPMLVAPAKTPTEIVNKLHAELNGILKLPETRQWLVKNGLTPVSPQSLEELQRFLKSEIARWGKVIEQIGIARSQ